MYDARGGLEAPPRSPAPYDTPYSAPPYGPAPYDQPPPPRGQAEPRRGG